MFATYDVFTLPDSYADSYSDSDSINVQKGYTGTDSDGDSNAKLLKKCENYLKNHLIGTNVCVKLGTVPICIGKGIGIGISIGPLYILKKTITPNSGIGIGIGVGQCKHTISL